MSSLHAAAVCRPFWTSPPRHRRHGASGGFTLLEVLVAIVVLSFGVLGVVGLQAASLQANKLARYQSTAVQLGNEFADLMRGNSSQGPAPYLITTDFYGDNSFPGGSSYVTPAPVDCSSTPCTNATNKAQFDVAEWKQTLANLLPGAHVVVCMDSAPYDSAGLPTFACTNGTNAGPVIKIGWTREKFNRTDTRNTATMGIDQASTPGVVIPVFLN